MIEHKVGVEREKTLLVPILAVVVIVLDSDHVIIVDLECENLAG